MNSKKWLATTISGGILAVSAAFGLTACSTSAASTDAGQAIPSQGASAGQQFDTTKMAAALATKLGVDQAKAKAALDTALAAAMPSGGGAGGPSGAPSGGPSGAPTGSAPSGAPGGGQPGDNSTMLAAVATSMAKALDLKEATVLTALQEVWTSNGPSGAPSGGATS